MITLSSVALAPSTPAPYPDTAMIHSNELTRWRDRHADHPVKQVELETAGVVGDIRVPRVIRRGLECSACEK